MTTTGKRERKNRDHEEYTYIPLMKYIKNEILKWNWNRRKKKKKKKNVRNKKYKEI